MDNKELEQVEDEQLEEVNTAVDDISRHDSDELIRNEDAKLAAAFSPVTSPWGKFKHWFGVRKNQYLIAGIGVALFALGLTVPA